MVTIIEQVVEILFFRKWKNTEDGFFVNTAIFIVEPDPITAVCGSGDIKITHVIVIEIQGILKEHVNILEQGVGIDFKDRLPFVQSVSSAEQRGLDCDHHDSLDA